jgi:hypothetical protein
VIATSWTRLRGAGSIITQFLQASLVKLVPLRGLQRLASITEVTPSMSWKVFPVLGMSAAYVPVQMLLPNYALERTVMKQRNHRRHRAAAQRERYAS